MMYIYLFALLIVKTFSISASDLDYSTACRNSTHPDFIFSNSGRYLIYNPPTQAEWDMYFNEFMNGDNALNLTKYINQQISLMCKDKFDFIGQVMIAPLNVAPCTSHFIITKNFIKGIGLNDYDISERFSTTPKVQGIFRVCIRNNGHLALSATVHEIMHRWLAFPRLATINGHWDTPEPYRMAVAPYDLAEEAGIFANYGYKLASIEMYLAGLIEYDEIEGQYSIALRDRIDNGILLMQKDKRIPNSKASQKAFRGIYVYVQNPNKADTDKSQIDRLEEGVELVERLDPNPIIVNSVMYANFHRQTRGKMGFVWSHLTSDKDDITDPQELEDYIGKDDERNWYQQFIQSD